MPERWWYAAVRWSGVLLAEDLGWEVVADDYHGAWMRWVPAGR